MDTLTKTKGWATLVALLLACSAAQAQYPSGGLKGSTSYNIDRRDVPRTLQYTPDGRDFVCVDGNNLYTRALYGGYTEYRVETSDRPIFAVYKRSNSRNVRFRLLTGGVEYPLEQTTHCEARYSDGARRYTLTDNRWGNGVLKVEVVAPIEGELAVWRFEAEGFADPVSLRALVCDIAKTRLSRAGDIGTDPRESFNAAPGDKNLETAEWVANGMTHFVIGADTICAMTEAEAAALFDVTMERNSEMAARITFDTPDPFINTLGGALVMAADGDWDGKTWLHGCVGWRMPLAGWRAGYLGDVLGWGERAVSHFDAYAKSQVTDVPATLPHPTQDSKANLARAEKRWGTQMYSNGYICRNPERNDQMHHYDMNLNYIDELLWHFCYDADTAYIRKMWPVVKAHLAWEKRNYDPDGDCLYDAYCCIWASDALYYNGGAVTHSSAYNYRGNLLAARMAEIIGEDPTPYRQEAEGIARAMDERLWIEDKGHWAEYEDLMGLGRRHESAAVWSVYTPIDCGVGTPEQHYRATRYVDRSIPHIPVVADGKSYGSTISTTNWLPYAWSINNVAAAEVMHTALSYFQAGRSDAGFMLMKANIMDQMYLGDCPGNFGQVSFYDAARGECYRDFGDCIGISARTLLQGLFGIVPDALNGRCVVRPGFPTQWDSAAVKTPYLSYKFCREGNKMVYDVEQNFAQPLTIVIRQNLGQGKYRDIVGNAEAHQVIETDVPAVAIEPAFDEPVQFTVDAEKYGLGEPVADGKCKPQNIDVCFNASVTDIFKNDYLSPRPDRTTLQIPLHGIGEWCHFDPETNINDSVFRSMVSDGQVTIAGIPFRTPSEGSNIAYTSLWDNYPDSIVVPLNGKATSAYLLMAGSTNHMQSRIDNGIVVATYKDGSADTLHLLNPDNWCPIEMDYYVDGKAFYTTQPRPIRIALGTGQVSRDLGAELGLDDVYVRPIPGGAAQMLKMPLNPKKKLCSLTVRTLSNDVVIGLMAVTLQ